MTEMTKMKTQYIIQSKEDALWEDTEWGMDFELTNCKKAIKVARKNRPEVTYRIIKLVRSFEVVEE